MERVGSGERIDIGLAHARHVESSLVLLIHTLWLSVDQSIHCVICRVAVTVVVVGCKAAHAGSATSAAPLTLIVARKRVTASKSTPAFRTDMRALACMEFGVSFQIV